MKNAAPLKGVFGIEETRIDADGAIKIETTDVEHGGDRNTRILAAVDFSNAVHGADTGFERIEIGGGGEVGFIQQNDIRECYLADGLVAGVEVELDVAGIDECDDGVEGKFFLHFVIDEEGLYDGSGISETRGFYQDVIELCTAFYQAADDSDEVAADGAADAAVIHFEYFFIRVDDEIMVNADFAKFIFDHRDAEAVVFGQDAVEQGSFTGAEESGEDSDRELGSHDIRSCLGLGGSEVAASSHQRRASSGGSHGFPFGRRLRARQHPLRQSAPWFWVIHCSYPTSQ